MKKNSILVFILIILGGFFACNSPIKQPLSMIALFTDHLVLQQNHAVPIWGTYTPGERVTVSANWGDSVTGITDESGNWKIPLYTSSAGGPFELTIATKDSTIVLKDVMIGEVWLASGQSNMEMPLTGYLPNEPIDNAAEEIANAEYPAIRMFKVKRNLSSYPKDDMEGDWQVCTPENAVDFSATGYFFARKLHQELGVPIGIINSSWGGTVAEAWTSKAGLSKFPRFLKMLDSYDNSAAEKWIGEFKTMAMPTNLDELAALQTSDNEINNLDFDDSKWMKMQLPAKVCMTENFIEGEVVSQQLNGLFWYRKKIEITNIDSDYLLTIGAIDDADVVYFNGEKIGATWNWQAKRAYPVSKSLLKKGTNIITIKHFDGGGGSNVSGPLTLESKKGKKINLEGEWSGLFYGDLTSGSLLVYGLDQQEKLKDRPIVAFSDPNGLPSSLYNAMIHPMVPYQLAGAIWYQGESNVGRDQEYESLFPAMIEDWRENWEEEFPFYFVQIAPFHYGDQFSPALRDAQRKSLRTPATGMAITMDIGDSLSIHPGNKQAVGDRLARLALVNDYNKKMVASGPLFKDAKIDENQIILSFDHTADGLELSGKGGFEIAGADKKFVPAEAKVINRYLSVSASQVSNPLYVRYGWRDYFSATLFNSEGLPASSFSTEE